jgi:hypothetical protein
MPAEGVVAVRYKLTATPWKRGWELAIEGVGTTQSRNLRDAEEMVLNYLRLDLGAKAASEVEIDLDIKVGGLESEVRRVKAELDRVSQEQRDVARQSREIASKLKRAGLTGADAARVMGVSAQRSSQLIGA